MRFLVLFMVFAFFPACGVTDTAKINATESKNLRTVSVGKTEVTIEHFSVESDQQCPNISLINKRGDEVIDRQSLCHIHIEGYRAFHALKDFSFIEFQNYRATDGATFAYDLDIAILRGSAFIAECTAKITTESIELTGCNKKEGSDW